MTAPAAVAAAAASEYEGGDNLVAASDWKWKAKIVVCQVFSLHSLGGNVLL